MNKSGGKNNTSTKLLEQSDNDTIHVAVEESVDEEGEKHTNAVGGKNGEKKTDSQWDLVFGLVTVTRLSLSTKRVTSSLGNTVRNTSVVVAVHFRVVHVGRVVRTHIFLVNKLNFQSSLIQTKCFGTVVVAAGEALRSGSSRWSRRDLTFVAISINAEKIRAMVMAARDSGGLSSHRAGAGGGTGD